MQAYTTTTSIRTKAAALMATQDAAGMTPVIAGLQFCCHQEGLIGQLDLAELAALQMAIASRMRELAEKAARG